MKPQAPDTPVIAVEGLTKSFGRRRVVDGVGLTVGAGEIAGFLGPNGSGKTTCIRMICGLLTPDAGRGTVLGLDLMRGQRAIRLQVGYMTQRFSLYEDLSIRQNLAFVAGLYHLPRQAVADTLEDLGLSSRRHQLAGSLSGGWKQRLALAACLMHRPKLLLLDEPTAGVDPKARRAFWDEIHDRAGRGMTVLVSTHYMDEAERCNRIHYIAHGRLVTNGTVDEVIAAAGLVTRSVETNHPAALAQELRRAPGVAQVEPFGALLHVTGLDAAALDAAIAAAGAKGTPVETSLEDVFIRLMEQAEDKMR
ncbi:MULTISPECIES: ABC transporter ATP-binding protein [unclassified Paracoccus (in: a-proteobacteria)]|uniref:ABC transporter ATP-binding protein n=1 Tax=unclassified Paracoccus (in: a-proteobacteria) TaxID=2688777 RepID=UPI0015FF523F|nr:MULTISPECIES: ABC transporter ATP-binding protein [unclassified Paracoccus (in: a-proteobacteria)]MBB1490157.1 ABC transporter ATP-binding protein [Paracoccus sp. MC1854]MBB1496744.1 ABC transporter ATP-binding protein [Paracoccus sp. MC1862]QQO43747.1 ABC transporter ATP-binding protein [Paracoccus sp. MC1862]